MNEMNKIQQIKDKDKTIRFTNTTVQLQQKLEFSKEYDVKLQEATALVKKLLQKDTSKKQNQVQQIKTSRDKARKRYLVCTFFLCHFVLNFYIL